LIRTYTEASDRTVVARVEILFLGIFSYIRPKVNYNIMAFTFFYGPFNLHDFFGEIALEFLFMPMNKPRHVTLGHSVNDAVGASCVDEVVREKTTCLQNCFIEKLVLTQDNFVLLFLLHVGKLRISSGSGHAV